MLSFLGTCLGIALLIGGGTLLVRGASDLATKFGVSPMVVGLTIVAFGTSAPELVVNSLGAYRGEMALAFGNVVGSNISNLGLVLGLTALIAPISIQGGIVRREIPLLLLGTVVLTVMALDGLLEGRVPTIGLSDSTVLLLLFCIFLYIIFLDFIRLPESDKLFLDIEESHVVGANRKALTDGLLVVGGLVLLFVGGETTIRNATALATIFNAPPTLIGLFVIAIGTSMPELVTSIIAALKGESDLALGNVIGSNIFNSLMVLPVTGLIRPIPIPGGGVSDLLVSLGFAAILIPVFFIGKARLGRIMGALLFSGYIIYAVYRITGI